MPLDLDKKFDEVRSYYAASASQKGVSFLVCGNAGCGKTHLLRTCPSPILLHSFDPGGSKTLKSEIESGRVIADNRFERDNPENPTAYKTWAQEFTSIYGKTGSDFEGVGTYAIDSLTLFLKAAMNAIVFEHRGAGGTKSGVPERKHYGVLNNKIHAMLNKILSIPCHVVITAHVEKQEDLLNGGLTTGLHVNQGLKTIPALFDEYYLMRTKTSSKGPQRLLITQPGTTYDARSRIAEGDGLALEELPDLKAILKKTGYYYEDK